LRLATEHKFSRDCQNFVFEVWQLCKLLRALRDIEWQHLQTIVETETVSNFN